MSDDHSSPEYLKKDFMPLIWIVGGVLVVGTAVTFAADLLGIFDSFDYAIAFALTVAFIKAAAVVVIFMHIKWDYKWKTISWTMLCTFIFFFGMMYLTLRSEQAGNKPGEGVSKPTGAQAEPTND